MQLLVDEAGWAAKGIVFQAFPSAENVEGYAFLIPPYPGSPRQADAMIAKDKQGNPILGEGDVKQLDLVPGASVKHKHLLAYLTGTPAPGQ